MWRPDGWDVRKQLSKLYKDKGWPDYEESDEEMILDAGADAMLEALRKKGMCVEREDECGVEVFIPDEVTIPIVASDSIPPGQGVFVKDGYPGR